MRTGNSWKFGVSVVGLALTALLGGCIAVGGTVQRGPEPTLGQQLIDLKQAEQTGAITPAEYDRLRAQLISSSTTGR
ncbi:MAG: hypothetical protein U0572_10740 [Phycisphaerales bacterium]